MLRCVLNARTRLVLPESTWPSTPMFTLTVPPVAAITTCQRGKTLLFGALVSMLHLLIYPRGLLCRKQASKAVGGRALKGALVLAHRGRGTIVRLIFSHPRSQATSVTCYHVLVILSWATFLSCEKEISIALLKLSRIERCAKAWRTVWTMRHTSMIQRPWRPSAWQGLGKTGTAAAVSMRCHHAKALGLTAALTTSKRRASLPLLP